MFRCSVFFSIWFCAISVCFAQETPSTRWAVLVGVDHYNSAKDLKYCGADVKALHDKLIVAGFPEKQIRLLHSDAKDQGFLPFKRNIEKQIDLILKIAGEQDLVILAFSGHGVHFGGKSYLCPTDAELDDVTSLVSLGNIETILRKSRASLKVVLIDACRNDPNLNGRKSLTSSVNDFARSLHNLKSEQLPEGVVFINSCAPGEISWEEPSFGHGVFMHYLLEGIDGKADKDNNSRITLIELITYADMQTKQFVADRFNEPQQPFLRGHLSVGALELTISAAERKKITLHVREGNRHGQLVEGADVRLLYSIPDSNAEAELDRSQTDSEGNVELGIPIDNEFQGEITAAIDYAGQTRRIKIDGYPKISEFTAFSPVRPPKKPIRVTLVAEKDQSFSLAPRWSIGADIVNSGGLSHFVTQRSNKKINITCLPDSVIGITIKSKNGVDQWLWLPINITDHEHTLTLRAAPPLVFINGDLAFIDAAILEAVATQGKEGRLTIEEAQSKLPGLAELAKLAEQHDNNLPALRGITVTPSQLCIDVLKPLKNREIGLFISDDDLINEPKVSQEFVQAFLSVKPRTALIPSTLFPKVKAGLTSTCALGLVFHTNRELPDLTALKRLTQLCLVDFNGSAEDELSLNPIRSVPQLQSLKLMGEFTNHAALKDLCNLEHLQYANPYGEHLHETSWIASLPRLQHLLISVSPRVDLSFVSGLPYLKTFVMTDFTESHDLTPLEESASLKTLAVDHLSKKDESDVTPGPFGHAKEVEYRNVRAFRKARKNIDILEYEGTEPFSLFD